MAVTIAPITPTFAGEVSGLDLRRPLSADDAAAIHDGMNRYAVLVFHGQDISDEQQLAFSRALGPLEQKVRPGTIRKVSESRLGAGMGDLSNLDRNGKIISADDRQWFFKLGDRLWHSDSSYAEIPAKYSALSGRVIPSWGGRTEFADMRAAYDALDDRTRAEVEDLVCEHSLLYSRGSIGFSEFTPEEIENFRPVRQRLVRYHPETGRKSLFLSSHAGAIVGWTIPEARSFLRDLTEHATQREFVYSHQWRQHDLVMWDNRTTMHRARRFDRTEVRDMRRTTLA
ncbi:MAG: TauD/TfdA family dioxygenase, partial [Proteobacteria bacterium]|nr:TauD/TfdA family dioxygenase [Pseudomonadota bacterium]